MTRVSRFLHCNLNCRDVGVAATLYEQALGMRPGMVTEPIVDTSYMGVPGVSSLEAHFMYDHRGGRRSPALELVQWKRPETTGDSYSDLLHVGMQSIHFLVPDVDETRRRLQAAGATVSDTVLADDPAHAGGVAILYDKDGVCIELAPGNVPGPTFRSVRILSSDIERSADWYGALGFRRSGSTASRLVRNGLPDVQLATLELSLADDPSFSLLVSSPMNGFSIGRAHSDASRRGLFRMALSVEDLEASIASMRRDGVIEPSPPSWVPLPGTPQEGIWASFFVDPDGIMVEVVGLTLATLDGAR